MIPLNCECRCPNCEKTADPDDPVCRECGHDLAFYDTEDLFVPIERDSEPIVTEVDRADDNPMYVTIQPRHGRWSI